MHQAIKKGRSQKFPSLFLSQELAGKTKLSGDAASSDSSYRASIEWQSPRRRRRRQHRTRSKNRVRRRSNSKSPFPDRGSVRPRPVARSSCLSATRKGAPSNDAGSRRSPRHAKIGRPWARGGIGRRAGFRFQYRKVSEFESRRAQMQASASARERLTRVDAPHTIRGLTRTVVVNTAVPVTRK